MYSGLLFVIFPRFSSYIQSVSLIFSSKGEAKFSLTFKKGGAIEFGTTLIELGRRACSAKQHFKPPNAYSSVADMNGAGQYYACPPPAYSAPYNDPYYGFVRPHEAFTVPQGK